MKRACHFTSVHAADDTRILLKECQALAAAGWETHLVAVNAEAKLHHGTHIHSVRAIRAGRLARMAIISWRVYRHAAKLDCDVYHFHDPELIPFALLLRLQGKKVIYDVHEDVPRDIMTKEWIAVWLRRCISWAFERFENATASLFSAVITATPAIAARFDALGCNVVNINNYPVLAELYQPDSDWSAKERAICYVGGINENRGAFEMVAAMGLVDGRLLMAGKFASTECRQKVCVLEGWDKIDELGQIERPEVKAVMARAMGGLVLFHPLPNHTEAQPNKLFEYMSAGIPVIASHFPLWEELIAKEECGLCVDPRDVAAIAQAITWIFDHPAEARNMGDNGRRTIEERYNWEQEKEKLLEVYRGF